MSKRPIRAIKLDSVIPERPKILAELSPSQKQAAIAFRDCDVLFLLGATGTGKTHVAMRLALRYAEETNCTITLSRPAVEAGECLGFIPGTVDDKMQPYLEPIHEIIPSVTRENEKDVKHLLKVCPLAFMRGRTFHGVAVLDEAQNCNESKLKLFLTRIGVGAKLIITGDPAQIDIHDSGLLHVTSKLKGVPGVGIIEMDPMDQKRHPLVTLMLAALCR